MEVHLRSVHADVGNGSPWCNSVLAKPEGSRYSNRLDCSIDTSPTTQPHDGLGCFAVAIVHSGCGAEALRYPETIVVDIDDNELARRNELCLKATLHSVRSAP